MRILRHRPTRHFIALLIGCRCGRKFAHRIGRPVVVCADCGRLAELATLVAELRDQEERRAREPRAARQARVA